MNDESDCDFDLDTRINVCESESDDHRDDDDVGTDGDNDVDHAPARLHRKKLKLVHGIIKRNIQRNGQLCLQSVMIHINFGVTLAPRN